MPYPLRCLFAVWMACVATGSVVVHHHDARAGHTHGYGWASVRSGCAASGCTHRHFVLFGVESSACDECEASEGAHAALSDCAAPATSDEAPAFFDLGLPLLPRDTVTRLTATAPTGRPPLHDPGRATHISSTILRL